MESCLHPWWLSNQLGAAIYSVINQCCRTSCCTCFHSGDPNQFVPFVLYVLYTELLYTHTSAALSASRSSFRLHKWYFVLKFCSVHFIGYNVHSTPCLLFRLEIINLFPKFVRSVGSKQRATTTLDFLNMSLVAHIFCCCFAQFPALNWQTFQHTFLYQVIFNPVCYSIFSCVTSDLFSFQPRSDLGGSPVESCLHPWWPSNQSGVLPTLVQYLYISCYLASLNLFEWLKSCP